jgi:deoxyribose-phosphate aldolase
VILETCLLTPEQIAAASTTAANAGADFVKTSTGFSTGGATIEAVTLMRKTVPARVQVKVRSLCALQNRQI